MSNTEVDMENVSNAEVIDRNVAIDQKPQIFRKLKNVMSDCQLLENNLSVATQCGNLVIFLSLRSFVKSILGILEVQNVPF